MGSKLLKIINTIFIPAILVILSIYWILVIYGRLSVIAGLILLVLNFTMLIFYATIFLLYLNLRASIGDYIDTLKRTNTMPIDVSGENRLKRINNSIIVIAIAIYILILIYLFVFAREVFLSGVFLIIPILLLTGYITIIIKARYLVLKDTRVRVNEAIITLAIILLSGILAWMFSAYHSFPLIVLIAVLILCALWPNIRRTISALKTIKNKPVGGNIDRAIDLYNKVTIAAIIITIVLGLFILMYRRDQLDWPIICIAILVIVAIQLNIMKAVSDVA